MAGKTSQQAPLLLHKQQVILGKPQSWHTIIGLPSHSQCTATFPAANGHTSICCAAPPLASLAAFTRCAAHRFTKSCAAAHAALARCTAKAEQGRALASTHVPERETGNQSHAMHGVATTRGQSCLMARRRMCSNQGIRALRNIHRRSVQCTSPPKNPTAILKILNNSLACDCCSVGTQPHGCTFQMARRPSTVKPRAPSGVSRKRSTPSPSVSTSAAMLCSDGATPRSMRGCHGWAACKFFVDVSHPLVPIR